MVTTVAVLASMLLCRVAAGHGYMTFPAARNSAWRFGFNTPINYNDMGLRAGGPDVVYAGPTKSFGVCGDPAAGPQVHAGGGTYATGKVTASFQAGDVVAVNVAVVAHHMGWFEMALCANPAATGAEKESCFVRLRRPGGQADGLGADNSDSYYWHLPPPSGGTSWVYTANFALPAGVTCARCVLRWHWVTNNNPPPGNPEEFWNCADIAITPRAASAPPLPPPLPAVPTTRFRVEVVAYNEWWLTLAPLPPAQAGRNGVVLLHPTSGRVPLAPVGGGSMVLGGTYSTGASAAVMPAAVGGMVEVEVTDADSGVVSRVCVALPACAAPCVSRTSCPSSASVPAPTFALAALPPFGAPGAPAPRAAPASPPPPPPPPRAAPVTPPPPPVAVPRAPPRVPVVSGGVAGYNYSEVVRLSMLFFEAQRAGRLPADTKARVPWRGDSCGGDGGDVGADLSGG